MSDDLRGEVRAFIAASWSLDITVRKETERALEASDSPHARDAIAYFAHRIRMEIGALAATIGGPHHGGRRAGVLWLATCAIRYRSQPGAARFQGARPAALGKNQPGQAIAATPADSPSMLSSMLNELINTTIHRTESASVNSG